MPTDPLVIDGFTLDPSVFGPTRGARCHLEECKGACCRNGVWLDVQKRDQILAAAAQVQAHLPPDRQDPSEWFDADEMVHTDFPSGRGVPTSVMPDPVDSTLDTCVFRRPDGLCALQCADPQLKPFDCYTYPLLKSEGEIARLTDGCGPLPHGDTDRAERKAHTPPAIAEKPG